MIFVDEEREFVGGYTSGARGYRIECTVRVVDLVTGQAAERRFRGDNPPSSLPTTTDGSVYGSLPDEDVADFINGLPRLQSAEDSGEET